MTNVPVTADPQTATHQIALATTRAERLWAAIVAFFWSYTEASEQADRSSFDGLL